MNGFALLAKLFSLGSIVLIAVLLAGFGYDTGYVIHTSMIAVIALGFFIYYARSYTFAGVPSLKDTEDSYLDSVIQAGVIATLGWVGMISFAAIYDLVPKLWHKPGLYSMRLVSWHFWLARQSLMPSFGVDQILKPAQIDDIAEFVLKISGQKNDVVASTRGAVVFKENCAACHGNNGEGNHDLGAPRLTHAITLYVSDKASIVAQIKKPRQDVMPAWSARLDEATIKQLTIYVHELGGGETPAP